MAGILIIYLFHYPHLYQSLILIRILYHTNCHLTNIMTLTKYGKISRFLLVDIHYEKNISTERTKT